MHVATTNQGQVINEDPIKLKERLFADIKKYSKEIIRAIIWLEN